ncbi:uncharacterized protein LOC110720729 [Chenopodium quinoa]|uniref:uncharacterized protein LOC110720729 n=1 Tax=Chenopodium quinoa TaxID=63459 RepID=UPI000B781F17|nr:uncharacterized protein LOC110720729 [Chenopodium quinoa]
METIDFLSFIGNNSGETTQASSQASTQPSSVETTQASSQETTQAATQATAQATTHAGTQSTSQAATLATTQATTEQNERRKYMKDVERKVCIESLLHAATNLKLPPGTINKLSHIHGVSRWTLQRIWKHVKLSVRLKQSIKISKNQKGKAGRKPIQLNVEQLMAVPLKKRGNIRSLASAMKINKSTVGRFVKKGKILRHSNAIKPTLTAVNKIQRLRWCMQQVISSTINTIPRFGDMYNVVHIDEKWFFMTKNSQTFYLAPNEVRPYRNCKSKRYDTKVMFEVALSRAVHGPDNECLFDGELGCFPLTEANWPIDACGTIWVQQDNATQHLQLHDIEFRNAANTEGFNIHLIAQPPNSPDLNVLDLGFFNTIQAIQHQQAPRNVDELVSAVKYAYEIFEPRKVNHVFLSLQYCMLEIMMVQGSNNYIQPHHAKERMERAGNLPTYIEVPIQLLKESMTSLLQQHMELHGLTNTVQEPEERAEAETE